MKHTLHKLRLLAAAAAVSPFFLCPAEEAKPAPQGFEYPKIDKPYVHLSQAVAETAFNINHAFVAQEQAAGTAKTSFPGPLGGTISLGYTVTPEKPETLSAVGLAHTNMMCGHPNAAGWSYTNWIYVPSIYVNTSAAASDVGLPVKLGPAQIHLHPGKTEADGLGQPASWAIVRYTVASSGTYLISGEFQSLNTGTVHVNVFRNGVSILSSGANSRATKFDEVVALMAGDLIDFGVGPTGSIICASTGLYASIAPAPPYDRDCGRGAAGNHSR